MFYFSIKSSSTIKKNTIKCHFKMTMKLSGNECGSWVEKAEVSKQKNNYFKDERSLVSSLLPPQNHFLRLNSIPHYQTSLGSNIWHQICPHAPPPEFCCVLILNVFLWCYVTESKLMALTAQHANKTRHKVLGQGKQLHLENQHIKMAD